MHKQNFTFFDEIYCINLPHRVDRKETVHQEFKKIWIDSRIKYFRAVHEPDNWHLWCLLSHRAIILEAKNNNFQNILVFEDDVEFTQFNPNILDSFFIQMNKKNWWLLYLGASFFPSDCPYLESFTGFYKINWCRSTHAICYNMRFYDYFLRITDSQEKCERLIRKYKWIDVYFSRIVQYKYDSYVPNQMICTQRCTFSDTEKKIINLEKYILSPFLLLTQKKNWIFLSKIKRFFLRYIWCFYYYLK